MEKDLACTRVAPSPTHFLKYVSSIQTSISGSTFT